MQPDLLLSGETFETDDGKFLFVWNATRNGQTCAWQSSVRHDTGLEATKEMIEALTRLVAKHEAEFAGS